MERRFGRRRGVKGRQLQRRGRKLWWNLFEFVECRYFEHFGPTSKSVKYSGLLSKAADKSRSVRVVTSPLSILTIISLMGVICMSRQFFSTLVGMELGSHDFADEPKKNFLILSSVCRSFKIDNFGFDCRFFALLQYLVLYPQILKE